MPVFVILALLGFWLYLAYQTYAAGNAAMGVILALIGVSLAIWRFGRSSRED
jgi:hypothetical protein